MNMLVVVSSADEMALVPAAFVSGNLNDTKLERQLSGKELKSIVGVTAYIKKQAKKTNEMLERLGSFEYLLGFLLFIAILEEFSQHAAVKEWSRRIVDLYQGGHFPQSLANIKKQAHEVQKVPRCMDSFRTLFYDYVTRYGVTNPQLVVLAMQSKETLVKVNQALWEAANKKKGQIGSACVLALLDRVEESDSSRGEVLEEFGEIWKKSRGIGNDKHRTPAQKATLAWLRVEAEEEEGDSKEAGESKEEAEIADLDFDQQQEAYFLRDFRGDYRLIRESEVPWYVRRESRHVLDALTDWNKDFAALLKDPDMRKWQEAWSKFPVPADDELEVQADDEARLELPGSLYYVSQFPFLRLEQPIPKDGPWTMSFGRYDETISKDHLHTLTYPPREDVVEVGTIDTDIFRALPNDTKGMTRVISHANSVFSISDWIPALDRAGHGPYRDVVFESAFDHATLWSKMKLPPNDMNQLELHPILLKHKDVGSKGRGTRCRIVEVIMHHSHTVDSVVLIS